MKYKHDCKICKYQGEIKIKNTEYDIYICPTDTGESRSIIARYGDKGSEYKSGVIFQCVELTDLDNVVLGSGIELNNFEKERLTKIFLREYRSKMLAKAINGEGSILFDVYEDFRIGSGNIYTEICEE